MRLPRLTTRRLMVLVAVAALSMTFVVRDELDRRRDSYLRLATHHEKEWTRITELRDDRRGRHYGWVRYDEGRRVWRLVSRARKDHEATLKEKYERAARYPWLPVRPDPPSPE